MAASASITAPRMTRWAWFISRSACDIPLTSIQARERAPELIARSEHEGAVANDAQKRPVMDWIDEARERAVAFKESDAVARKHRVSCACEYAIRD